MRYFDGKLVKKIYPTYTSKTLSEKLNITLMKMRVKRSVIPVTIRRAPLRIALQQNTPVIMKTNIFSLYNRNEH